MEYVLPEGGLLVASLRLSASGSRLATGPALVLTSVVAHLAAHLRVLRRWGTTSSAILAALLAWKVFVVLETHVVGYYL